jgi:hypothetical protein
MRPRVERHLAGQINELANEFRNLPSHPILSVDYEEARILMRDEISLAMKWSMTATTYMDRSEKPEKYNRTPCRQEAAKAWWGFRAAIRRARMFHGFARVFLAFDQDHITA